MSDLLAAWSSVGEDGDDEMARQSGAAPLGRNFQAAPQRLPKPSSSSLPWDTDAELRDVMGSGSGTTWLAPLMQLSVGVPLTIDCGKRNRVCIFPEVFTNRKRVLATVVDKTVDDARSDAIDKWAAILHLNPASAQLGRQLFAVHDLDDAGALVLGTVTDVLAPKSTGTLQVRATAFLLIVKWFLANHVADEDELPLSESVLYDYLSCQRRQGAPHTRLASNLQAWSFCVHAIGFDGPTVASGSLTSKSSAHSQFLRKCMLSRRNVLSMVMLANLEIAAVYHCDPVLRLSAGFCCLCTHGRLRCADGNCIRRLDSKPLTYDQPACFALHEDDGLTATGKAGADLHCRQMLGYHVPEGESSALNYRPDNLAQPIEVLSSPFQAPSAGVFMPGKQRASRGPEAQLVPLPAQVEQVPGCTLDQLKQKIASRATLASHAEGTEESTLVTIPSHPTSPSKTQEQPEALPSPIASSDVFGQEDSPQMWHALQFVTGKEQLLIRLLLQVTQTMRLLLKKARTATKRALELQVPPSRMSALISKSKLSIQWRHSF
jgi:hypothetical protein